VRKARALRTALSAFSLQIFVRLFDAVEGKTGAPTFRGGGAFFVRRALRPFRLAAGGAAPARGGGVDGQEVADLGDAFDAGSHA
jgi:hypothetical protein